MATFERHSEVNWQGGLMDGKGEAKAGTGAFTPYVGVRGRLEARLTRPLAFDLADCIETDGEGRAFIASGGARFLLPEGALGGAPERASR